MELRNAVFIITILAISASSETVIGGEQHQDGASHWQKSREIPIVHVVNHTDADPTSPPLMANSSTIQTPNYSDIVGGRTAKPGDLPWIAKLKIKLRRDKILCGGSILSSRWILTAAHCLEDNPTDIVVIMGDVGRKNSGDEGIRMYAESAVVNPRYSEGGAKYDIALIKMSEKIPFGNTIQPIRIAGREYKDTKFAGVTGLVAGWGITSDHNERTPALKWGEVEIMANSKCRKYWDVNKSQLCTVPQGSSDACSGDSGGPLVVWDQSGYLQVGIVSYGDKYCPSRKPGVFTSVSSYASWIRGTTGLKV